LARPNERQAVFHPEFRDDLKDWVESDRKVALRVLDLVEAVMRDPFTGIGKPEPLKFVLAGCWSRRITQEHRLVYKVRENRIDFLQARYHYRNTDRADHGGHVSEYFRTLLPEARAREDDARLEALLVEGLTSGEEIPLTKEFWRELKSKAAGIARKHRTRRKL